MPIWAFVPLVLVAALACPISMWVMGRMSKRKMSCPACGPGAEAKHKHTAATLEARKAELERQIAELERKVAAPVGAGGRPASRRD